MDGVSLLCGRLLAPPPFGEESDVEWSTIRFERLWGNWSVALPGGGGCRTSQVRANSLPPLLGSIKLFVEKS